MSPWVKQWELIGQLYFKIKCFFLSIWLKSLKLLKWEMRRKQSHFIKVGSRVKGQMPLFFCCPPHPCLNYIFSKCSMKVELYVSSLKVTPDVELSLLTSSFCFKNVPMNHSIEIPFVPFWRQSFGCQWIILPEDR